MSTKKPSLAPKEPVHALFDFDDSDITLRSSDGMHFRVHKGRLSAASLFFKEMFEGELGTPNAAKNDIPQLAEPADTLAVLFAMCYPYDTDNAPFDIVGMDPALLMACFEASEKYNMWVAQQLMQHLVMPLVEKDPFRLVRTGYVLRKESLLSAAASATLAYDVVPYARAAEYREKAGNTWAALLRYHIIYKRVVTMTIHDMHCTLGSRTEKEQWFYCDWNRFTYCENAKTYKTRWQGLRYGLEVLPTPAWPKDALLRFIDGLLDEPDLRRCSGCTRTWKELRIRVIQFEPTITLTLEQIDQSLS